MNNEMITVREAAKFLRLSLPTVYKLLQVDKIPHVKVGCRYIIPRDKFMAWVLQNVQGGDNNG